MNGRSWLVCGLFASGLLVIAACTGSSGPKGAKTNTTIASSSGATGATGTGGTGGTASSGLASGGTTTTLDIAEPTVTIGDSDAAGRRVVSVDASTLHVTGSFRDTKKQRLYRLRTKGQERFTVDVQLYVGVAPGWTGQPGRFATDCIRNGICVYVDIDGSAGDTPLMQAEPGGSITIVSLQPVLRVTLDEITLRLLGREDTYALSGLVLEASTVG